jgi:hypothetical protein
MSLLGQNLGARDYVGRKAAGVWPIVPSAKTHPQTTYLKESEQCCDAQFQSEASV